MVRGFVPKSKQGQLGVNLERKKYPYRVTSNLKVINSALKYFGDAEACKDRNAESWITRNKTVWPPFNYCGVKKDKCKNRMYTSLGLRIRNNPTRNNDNRSKRLSVIVRQA